MKRPWLKKIVEKADGSVTVAAPALGVTPRSMFLWFGGIVTPDIRQKLKLAARYGPGVLAKFQAEEREMLRAATA